MSLRCACLLIIISAILPLNAGASPDGSSSLESGLTEETLLVDTLNYIQEQRLDDALHSIETLVGLNPKFRLAQLVYGDLLLAKSKPISEFGNFSPDERTNINALREEARSRLRGHRSTPTKGTLPANLLRLASSQKQVVVIDLEMSRLYLFENKDNKLNLLANYYASSGKNGAVKLLEGDRKTPVGVYFVSQYIPGDELPDLYGAGAFPIDYPNPWDQRLGRTGHGIWLHGVPSNTYSLTPRSSNGCVAIANADFKSITPLIEIGKTPVIIAEKVDWQESSIIQKQRSSLEKSIEKWRQDWESLDMRRYATNYSRKFRSGKHNYSSWVERKTIINQRKTSINVGLSDMSIFSDPGEQGLAVVKFQQSYESNNYNGNADKRQYWKHEEDDVWRIVYEGAG
ncbi:ErfK/YbiS/YcfS/YnhG [hydrothermal vent metagenome]|uniref:ErfK/YbiS/YcfS/YnhG n=1 Tax=hydrothermal vent metagenome TaxID=652676 RepID=A0A3B1BI76_9ZZZZ